jgi:hypothetical protein
MFAAKLMRSWIGALVLTPGAFCQTFIPFSVMPSVGSATIPASINRKGEIAGIYGNFSVYGSSVHGFVREPGGAITTFDVPGSSTGATSVSSINDEGAITG